MKRHLIPALALLLSASCGESPKPLNTGATAPDYGTTETPGGGETATPARNGELVFELPEGWIEETPRSSMRWKQFSIAVEGGDPIELTAFSSRNIGGTVRQNIDRWVNQMVQADGSESKSVAMETTKEVGELKMTTVEVPGMFQNSTMMGGSGETLKTARLLGTVVETPYGNYFFKLVGENEAVLALKPAYGAFLDSMKP